MTPRFQHKFNHYQLLGIERSASSDEIRNAYLALIRKFHPDHFDEETQEWENANEFTRLLNAAYEVLSDPAKRKRYDESLGVRSSSTVRDAAGQREEGRGANEARNDPWEQVFREQKAKQQAEQAERLREKRLKDLCDEVCVHLGIMESETFFDCLPDRVREKLLQLQRDGIEQFKPIPEPSPWDSGWSWTRCWTTVLSISVGIPLVTWLLAYWMELDGRFIVYPAIIGQMLCVWKLTKKVRQQTEKVFRIKGASLGRYLYVTPLYVFTTEADKIHFYPCHTVEITEELLLEDAVRVFFRSAGKTLFETKLPPHESAALRKQFWEGLETIRDAYVNKDNTFFSKYNYFKYPFWFPHKPRRFSVSIPAYCFSLVVPLVSVVWASLAFLRGLPLEKGRDPMPETAYSSGTSKPTFDADTTAEEFLSSFSGGGANPATSAVDDDFTPARSADEFMAQFRRKKAIADAFRQAESAAAGKATGGGSTFTLEDIGIREESPEKTMDDDFDLIAANRKLGFSTPERKAPDAVAEYQKTHAPLAPPASGTCWNWSYRERVAPLEISAPTADNCFVKLVDHYTNVDVMGIFVRAGTTTEVDVPLGTYDFRYAMGSVWYGTDKGCLFGPETICAKANTLFRFYESGDRVNGHAVTLYRVRNGNMSTSTISLEDF